MSIEPCMIEILDSLNIYKVSKEVYHIVCMTSVKLVTL